MIGSSVMVIVFVVVLWFLPHVALRSGSAHESRGNRVQPTPRWSSKHRPRRPILPTALDLRRA
jgi:hypothetical protein